MELLSQSGVLPLWALPQDIAGAWFDVQQTYMTFHSTLICMRKFLKDCYDKEEEIKTALWMVSTMDLDGALLQASTALIRKCSGSEFLPPSQSNNL